MCRMLPLSVLCSPREPVATRAELCTRTRCNNRGTLHASMLQPLRRGARGKSPPRFFLVGVLCDQVSIQLSCETIVLALGAEAQATSVATQHNNIIMDSGVVTG